MKAIARSVSGLIVIAIVLIAAGAVYYYSSSRSNAPTLSSTNSTAGPVIIQFYEALAPSEAAYFSKPRTPTSK
jgi:flagellar basal body-associated protein FliL